MTRQPRAELTKLAFAPARDGAPVPFLRSREKFVDRLFYGVFNRSQIQVVSGIGGAGKSSVLQRLALRVDGRRSVVWLNAAGIRDSQALTTQLYRGLTHDAAAPAAADGSAGQADALSARLQELEQTGLPATLLIDDCEAMPPAGRSALAALAGAERAGGLRAVVACHPDTAAELAADSRYWTLAELRPLSPHGTERYLFARMAVAGLPGPGPFDPQTIAEVHRESGGWPGHIDGLARDLIEEQAPAQHRDTRSGIGRTLTVLLVIGLLAGAGWWYFTPLSDWARTTLQQLGTPRTQTTAAAPSTTVPTPRGDRSDPDTGSMPDQVTADAGTDATQPLDRTAQPATPGATAETPAAAAVAAGTVDASADTVADAIATAAPSADLQMRSEGTEPTQARAVDRPVMPSPPETPSAPVVAPAAPPTIAEAQPDAMPRTSTGATTQEAEPAPEPAALTDSNPSGEGIPEPASGPTPTAAPALAPTAATAPATDAEPVAAAAPPTDAQDDQARVHDRDWILARDPAHWTLQLLVANSERHLTRLIDSTGLGGDWAYYRTRRGDSDRYTLFYGDFPSREQALQAVPQIKPHIDDAWMRNFASIQRGL